MPFPWFDHHAEVAVKYYVSVPQFLIDRLEDGEPVRVNSMMQAMNGMKKMDVVRLEEAYYR